MSRSDRIDAQILQGDVLEQLRALPDDSVQCCVTSPPYWGLRDYGVAGQIGLEPTVDEWVARMVAVFREVRRVLRKDGLLWLNLGDAYATRGGHRTHNGAPSEKSTLRGHGHVGAGPKTRALSTAQIAAAPTGRRPGLPGTVPSGVKPKDLIGQPWRVAFALQADGWWLRDAIVWNKPNPMPESVRDRCTKAYEFVFMFAKSRRYYFDADAISEPASLDTHARVRVPGNRSHKGQIAFDDGAAEHRTKAGLVAYAQRQRDKLKPVAGWMFGEGDHSAVTHAQPAGDRGDRKLLRDVGVGDRARPRKAVPNEVDRGSRENLKFGRVKNNASFDAALRDTPERRNRRNVWTIATEPYPDKHFATFPSELPRICIAASTQPGDTVLDPFAGSGTTLAVALELGRQAVGIELNPKYCDLIRRRLARTTIGLNLEMAA